MIALITLLSCVLAAYLGYQIGLFRAFMVFGSVLFGGMAAFNWGVPLALALAPEVTGAVTPTVVVAFLGASGILFFIAYRLAPHPLRMPWLLDDAGGAVVGILFGWLVAGILLGAARYSPDVDGWIRRTRGEQYHASRGTPDGFWFATLGVASEGGLQRNPKRPFNVDVELPPQRAR